LITIGLAVTGWFGNKMVSEIEDTKTVATVSAVVITNHEGRITGIETFDKGVVTWDALNRRHQQNRPGAMASTNDVDLLGRSVTFDTSKQN
jgi:hypothetical protein